MWEFDSWDLSLPSGISPIPKSPGVGQVLPCNSQFFLFGMDWEKQDDGKNQASGGRAGILSQNSFTEGKRKKMGF